MNIIEKLQRQIDDANSILRQQESVFQKEPQNFAYKLSISSLKNHIEDLQTQLRKEKTFREKEVLEVHLYGPLAAYGTIPLTVLAKISHYLADTLLATSQRKKIGPKFRGKIPQDIIDTLDLRLAGVGVGSTRLFITGNTAPDIFGYSLLENSLEHTFDLLHSETPDNLSEAASKLGIRSINRLNSFLKTLASYNLDVKMHWSSPALKSYEWEATKDAILHLTNSLDKIKHSEIYTFKLHGKLVTVSLRGSIEIETIEGRMYKGTFPSSLTDDMKKLHIGDMCSAVVEQETIINQTTNFEKKYYTVISINKSPDEPVDVEIPL
jgi:hypothetical protein